MKESINYQGRMSAWKSRKDICLGIQLRYNSYNLKILNAFKFLSGEKIYIYRERHFSRDDIQVIQ